MHSLQRRLRNALKSKKPGHIVQRLDGMAMSLSVAISRVWEMFSCSLTVTHSNLLQDLRAVKGQR